MSPVSQLSKVVMCLVMLLSSASGMAQELSDPTLPPQQAQAVAGSQQVAASGLQLQSIQFMGTKRSAQINGQRVYEQEPLGQFMVEKIDMNFVTLRNQQTNKTVTLRLFGFTKNSVTNSGTDL